jgi:hypothetical protein
MESAKIFGRIINFKNVSAIEDELKFRYREYDGNSVVDREGHLIAEFSIRYLGDQYWRYESFYLGGLDAANISKNNERKAEFKRFLECFDRYCVNNVVDCSKEIKP